MRDRTVLQWGKDDCATAGLVKFDLLGVGMLSAVCYARDLIAAHHGVHVDLAHLDLADPAVYEMLQRADTVEVFSSSRWCSVFVPATSLALFVTTSSPSITCQISSVKPGRRFGYRLARSRAWWNSAAGTRYDARMPSPPARRVRCRLRTNALSSIAAAGPAAPWS